MCAGCSVERPVEASNAARSASSQPSCESCASAHSGMLASLFITPSTHAGGTVRYGLSLVALADSDSTLNSVAGCDQASEFAEATGCSTTAVAVEAEPSLSPPADAVI